MKNLPNIEKSGFHHGQYVGYANGNVYRIVRTGKLWAARPNGNGASKHLYATTLAELSKLLENVK